jgi:5-methylcytosine-specific restriction endonuclease McrA
MSARPEPDRGAIAFAERLMTVLGEGRFTATYKYAVLLALIDVCLEHSTKSGSAPESVTTRQLAEKVLELYWSHTLPYQTAGAVLRQNSGARQAGIVSAIRRFRERHAEDAGGTPFRARQRVPHAFERLVETVEWKLIEMPLPRLQTIGTDRDEFLYQIRWDERITRSRVESDDFDNLIRFTGAAGDHLIRLSGLLRPLIEREWVRQVAQWNRGVVPELGLHEFLFGVERIDLTPVRGPLSELAGGRCFYCDRALRAAAEVDHFIPWSRHPDNGIENLVVSDTRCNGAKRDHLAAGHHVARWIERAREHGSDLARIAASLQWDRHAGRSQGVARSLYLRLPAHAKLWSAPHEFVAVDRDELARLFAAA